MCTALPLARLLVAATLPWLLAGCTWPLTPHYPAPAPARDAIPLQHPQPPPPDPNAPRLEVRENTYDDGALRTRWQVRISPDGQVVRHGGLLRYHPGGKLALRGQYREGRPSGVWSWYDERGDLLRTAVPQEGYDEVLSGRELENPNTVYRDAQGRKVAEGLRKHDLPHGLWRYYYTDGALRAQGDYLNGLPDGRWHFYFHTGQVERVEDYRIGVPHGTVERGWPNGQERLEGHVEQGLRVGRWRTWHANGQVESDGTFREDLREGDWRYWDREGVLVRHLRYGAGQVLAELPLPTPRLGPPPLIVQPGLLPFRPRIYDEGGAEIRLQEQ